MARWTITTRHAAQVSREQHEDLSAAIDAARRRAQEIVDEGPRETVFAIRDYEPADQVVGRVEIAGKGLLRPPTAGVDVRGDGSLIPFRGSVRREMLDTPGAGDPFDVVRAVLEE